MIDYDLYLRIHHLRKTEKLSKTQIAHLLGIDRATVSKWLRRTRYQARETPPRPSKLDYFKPQILRWIGQYRFSGEQIYQKLRLLGYDGGKTILNDYLRSVRPQPQPAYLKLRFDPGDCAQVDWGECGAIHIGNTRRKLQVFVMVMCFSRMLYLRFYLSQSLECFLDAHVRAFEFFGGIPRRLMIDNLKTAVLEHRPGAPPEYHPRYLDLAQHYGFAPIACNVAKGNEKGRVERGVGYIKGNFLAGRQIGDLAALQAAGEAWRDLTANERIHGTTRQSPRQLFEEKEQPALLGLRLERYDTSISKQVRLSKDGRIQFETNTYSVPPGQRSSQLLLKVEAERIRIHSGSLHSEPLAIHRRCYARHQDIEDPAHTRQLKVQRQQAREQNLSHDFRALGGVAVRYYEELQERHLDYREQVRRLLALKEIHGEENLLRALQDALDLEAINAAYIENLLEGRQRVASIIASPLHLTRREDQLELFTPPADLDIYSKPQKPKN